MRKPGLSKSNERKLGQAAKLLGQVMKNLAEVDTNEREIYTLREYVAKAAHWAVEGTKELRRKTATRSFAVNFWHGKVLAAAYGTEGENLTLDGVILSAERYRMDPSGFADQPAPDLSGAKLEVYEIVPGAKTRLVVRRAPGAEEVTRTMENV